MPIQELESTLPSGIDEIKKDIASGITPFDAQCNHLERQHIHGLVNGLHYVVKSSYRGGNGLVSEIDIYESLEDMKLKLAWVRCSMILNEHEDMREKIFVRMLLDKNIETSSNQHPIYSPTSSSACDKQLEEIAESFGKLQRGTEAVRTLVNSGYLKSINDKLGKEWVAAHNVIQRELTAVSK